ncbi:MAG: hypothetical protein ACJ8C4_18650 [Gemmataceae bacterium]
MSKDDPAVGETDPRFPSGKWGGFFLMPHTGPKRHATQMVLDFKAGAMNGAGQDKVGKFVIKGVYDLATGKCEWIKTYVGAHDVHYVGYNEGKGIWGTWSIPAENNPAWRGGFHIWPEGMAGADPSKLSEEADAPVDEADPVLIPI